MNVSTPSMKKLLRLSAIAMAMALGLSASEHHGQVKFGGLPMSGVSVTATKDDQKVTAVTDQQGVYEFRDLADGVWKFQIEMLCFETQTQEVGVAPTAPSPSWELKLQTFDQIKAVAPPPETAAPVTTAAAAPAAGSATPAKNVPAAKGKGKGPVVP